MAAGGPTKTYAEAVRIPGQRSRTAVAERFQEDDEWTDVSSVMSCSWPSAAGSTEEKSNEVESPAGKPELMHDILIDDYTDSRGQRALRSAIHYARRSSRFYDEVHACFNIDKPWRPFPGCSDNCRRERSVMRTVERKKRRRGLKRETRDTIMDPFLGD